MYRREYREYQLSSRVDTMRWMGVLQLIMGILIFIIAIVMSSIELEEVAEADGRKDRAFFALPIVGNHVLWFAVPVLVMAVGAGAAGSILSRYEGLMYNVPARHLLLVLSVMNGTISLAYLIFGGQITFELVDANFLDEDQRGYVKATVALMIVILVLVFFNMLIAFICAVVTAMWNPPMDTPTVDRAPVVERVERVDRPVYVEEKPYYSRGGGYAYSDSPYYARGARTLPALKYY